MGNTDYVINSMRGAAQELYDISETELKKAISGISGGAAELSLHCKGGAAPAFFKRLNVLENLIHEIDRGLTGLADDIEREMDNKRRTPRDKSDETGN